MILRLIWVLLFEGKGLVGFVCDFRVGMASLAEVKEGFSLETKDFLGSFGIPGGSRARRRTSEWFEVDSSLCVPLPGGLVPPDFDVSIQVVGQAPAEYCR